MSLINEALKRARDASSQSAPMREAPMYEPGMSAPIVVPSSRPQFPVLLLLVGILVTAGLLAVWIQSTRATRPVPTQILAPVAAIPPVQVVPEPIPAPETTPAVASGVTPQQSADADEVLVTRIMERLKEEQADEATVAVSVADTAKPAPVQSTEPEAAAIPAPAPVPPAVPPALNLQAVMVHGASRQAIINGRGVQVGDIIDGAELIRIEQRTVAVRWNDQEITLRMP
jgi:hypothetical protein